MGATITPNDHLPSGGLIKQPVNSDLRVENGVLQLTEKWKGLYSHCQAVARALYSTEAVYYNTFQQFAGNLSAEYSTPTPPTNMAWQLAQATVDECDAGENGLLQVIWNCVPDPNGSGGSEDWPSTETWQLQWQPENYDVYAYCKNPTEHQDDAQNGSQRTAVENCLHPPTGQNIMTMSQVFSASNSLFYALNDNEKKILTWKLEGKHVIKHHPTIQKTKTWTNIPKSKVDSVVDAASSEIGPVDVIDTPDETFGLDDYTWVCQGTNIQQSKPDVKKNEFSVVATTQWIGALSVVTEFYGPNAWKFGEM